MWQIHNACKVQTTCSACLTHISGWNMFRRIISNHIRKCSQCEVTHKFPQTAMDDVCVLPNRGNYGRRNVQVLWKAAEHGLIAKTTENHHCMYSILNVWKWLSGRLLVNYVHFLFYGLRIATMMLFFHPPPSVHVLCLLWTYIHGL